MAEPSITFEGIWKKFRRGEHHDSLRDLIPALLRRLSKAGRPQGLAKEEFWAVHNVSFQAKAGDSIGIIGPNGAGKSTILKLLTRILKPTLGRCHVHGRVGALIEVAAGFHPDLTGRENVYLQGAIMGMKRAEISRKFDEIVEFAGVREFIETPVKRYSSGMNARLGFSIAAHLDPEVLIIDEVLSVGDSGFQDRCIARMRGLLRQGIPLVFVSHNLQAVQDLCNQVLVLNRGEVAFQGPPQEGIRKYRNMVWTPPPGVAKQERPMVPIWIAGVQFLDEKQSATDFFKTGSEMTVRIQYEASRRMDQIHVAVEIHRIDGVYCYGINTNMDRVELRNIEGKGEVDLRFPALNLLPGSYSVSVGILDNDSIAAHDVHHLAYQLTVVSERRDHGFVFLEHEWRQSTVRGSELACAEHANDRK
jgi:lipopolysaccharide transport system ATP-binding protein